MLSDTREEKPTPKTETKTKRNKTKQEDKSVKNQIEKPKLTKTERRAKYNELKRELKQVWSMEMESEGKNKDTMSVPSHFKRYTIHNRKVIVQQPRRTLEEPGQSYDGPENAKKIDPAEEGEEPKPAYIANDLLPEEEELLIKTLKEYKDVFAWSYRDLKGVDPDICQSILFL